MIAPLQILIASGPFTQSDTLNYQPLADLATYAAKHKPDVVILIGPFVDATHPLIEDCTLAETFQSFFEKLLVLFMEPLKGYRLIFLIKGLGGHSSNMLRKILPFWTSLRHAASHFSGPPLTNTL